MNKIRKSILHTKMPGLATGSQQHLQRFSQKMPNKNRCNIETKQSKMCKGLDGPLYSSNTNSIVQQLGGENIFDFLLMTFCESIREDASLQTVLKGMKIKVLISIMRSVLHVALERNTLDEDARNRLVLQNYSLFELGMNTEHFQQLQAHFESALHECWVEDGLLHECIQRFGALRPIFEEEGLWCV